MTIWDERFSASPVFEAMKAVRLLLESAESLLATPELREAHGRLERVTRYLERQLAACDPEITAPQPLETITNHLNQAATHVQNFINNQQPDELITHANQQIDGILRPIRMLPVPEKSEDVEGLREDVTRFRQSAGAHLRYLQADLDDFKGSLAGQLEQAQASISSTEAQIQARLQELNSEKQRLDKAIAEFQEQFLSTESERTAKFGDATEKRGEAFREFISESEKNLSEYLDDLDSRAKKFIEHFERKKAEVETLAGAVGATGLTGGFQEAASDEARQANLWRAVGVAAILSIVAVTIFLFGPLEGVPEWNRIAAKALVSVPLAALAAYALTESGKHRNRQARNRRLAIELASIDPYLSLMPEPDRREVKKLLVERWFAQAEPIAGKDDVSKKTLVALIGDAIKMLGEKG